MLEAASRISSTYQLPYIFSTRIVNLNFIVRFINLEQFTFLILEFHVHFYFLCFTLLLTVIIESLVGYQVLHIDPSFQFPYFALDSHALSSPPLVI